MMSKVKISLLAMVMFLTMAFSFRDCFSQIGPYPGGSISTLQTYRPEVPYSIGNVVIMYGILYQSVVNNNQGNAPISLGGILNSNWTRVIGNGSGGGASFPSTPGIVFSTTSAASRNATSGDITDLLGFVPLANNANAVSSTTASSLSGPSVLPDGTTATTGPNGQGGGNVATQQYVENNSSGGGSTTTTYNAGANITANTVVMGDGFGNVIPFVNTSGNYGLYIGVATTSATSGNPTTIASGSGQFADCQFDGTPAIGNAVIGSSTPGQCHDNGNNAVFDVGAFVPTIGWVQSVSGTVASVRLAGLGVSGTGNVVRNNILGGQTFFGPLTMWAGIDTTQVGNIFHADGFSNGNNYLGIGVAQTPWDSSINYGQCSAVSVSSGSITGWLIANTAANSNSHSPAFSTATFTMANSLSPNQWVTLSGFGTSTFFNGMSVQVISTGLSGSQFEAVLPSPQTAGSGSEAGAAARNYLSVVYRTTNTPGSASNVWYPVPNGNTPTALDCAFYSVAASVVTGSGTVISSGLGASLVLGSGVYLTNIGLLEPTVATPTQPTISIYGQGAEQTIIRQGVVKNDPLGVLVQPKTLGNFTFAGYVWKGFTVDAAFRATSVADIYGSSAAVLEDLTLLSPADFNDHGFEVGDYNDTAHGWVFQPVIHNVNVGFNRGTGKNAVIRTTISGGVPTFTIVNGGSQYSNVTPPTVTLVGYADFGHACNSPGTTTVTVTSGVITGITSSATGCVDPVYVSVYSGLSVTWGIKFSNVSDSEQIDSIASSIGLPGGAGMVVSNISSQITVSKYHPDNVALGLMDEANDEFDDLQCDTIRQICVEVLNDQHVYKHPIFEWSDNNSLGYVDWYFPQTTGTIGFNTPLSVRIQDEQCGNAANFAGYAHMATGAGYVDYHLGSGGGTLPTYVKDTHAVYCNELLGASTPPLTQITPDFMGNTYSWTNGVYNNAWLFNLGTDFGTSNTQVMTVNQANQITGANLGNYIWNWNNPNPATSSFNPKAPAIKDSAAYWDGAVTQPLSANQHLSFAAGTGPLATYLFDHTGTLPSGGFVWQFDATVLLPILKISGITGSTQCLHADTNGLVSGTGSDCGSSGGTVSSVTNSDGTLTISPSSGSVVASLALGNANTWTGQQTFNAPLALQAATAATSSANQNSPSGQWVANYWTGTASANDTWFWQVVLGTGPNPTSTYTLMHNGSSGTSLVSVPSLVVSGLGTSTNSVCPNGVGGSLTTSGCSSTTLVSSSETVSSSATPTFSVTTNVSYMVLTVNVTTFTLPAGADGQSKVICWQQASGAFTVAPPANVHGFIPTMGTVSGGYNCQGYVYNAANSIWLAHDPGVINE